MSGTVKDARIMAPEGERAAEDLRRGCAVICLGGRSCLIVEGRTDTVFGCMDVETSDGRWVRLSPMQLLPLADGSHELAGALCVGDELLDYAGRPVGVVALAHFPVYLTVCRLATEAGTYIAERVALLDDKRQEIESWQTSRKT